MRGYICWSQIQITFICLPLFMHPLLSKMWNVSKELWLLLMHQSLAIYWLEICTFHFLKEKSCRCCQCCQCCLCCHYCHCCHCYLCIFRIPQSIFTSSLMTVVDYTQSWSNLFSLKRWRNVDCWLGEKTKEVKTLRNAKVLTSSLSFKEKMAEYEKSFYYLSFYSVVKWQWGSDRIRFRFCFFSADSLDLPPH